MIATILLAAVFIDAEHLLRPRPQEILDGCHHLFVRSKGQTRDVTREGERPDVHVHLETWRSTETGTPTHSTAINCTKQYNPRSGHAVLASPGGVRVKNITL